MADQPTIWREPEIFSAGDTLKFQKYLPNYQPGDGWVLHYALTQSTPNAAEKVAEFTSSTSATDGTCHAVNVDDFAIGLEGGDYILTGRVGKAATGEAHTFYIGELTLNPDLADGLATGPVLTEAQEMLAALRASYKDLLKLKYAVTEVQRNRFEAKDEASLLEQIKYWKAVRQNEIQQERIRNGQPAGNVQDAVFCIG